MRHCADARRYDHIKAEYEEFEESSRTLEAEQEQEIQRVGPSLSLAQAI